MGKPLLDLRRLAAWYGRRQRVLPWRQDPSLYRVWVSEIMLQQTQVSTVIPYFERFIARFPDVFALAQASEAEVLEAWQGLGYYSRARNLRKAATMVAGASGLFPSDREGWLELPGVGNYTAGAILSIALNQPEAILDGNVERVLARVRRVRRQDSDAHYKEQLWKLSRRAIGEAFEAGIAPRDFNQALMELGALVCTPQRPSCGGCPLREGCQAFAKGAQESYPEPRKRAPRLDVREQVLWLERPDGRIRLRQSQPGEWRAGLWDLPRDRAQGRRLGDVTVHYVVTRHDVRRTIEVRRVRAGTRGAPRLARDAKLHERWAFPDELPTGAAFKKSWKAVRARFSEARQAD